MWGYKYVPLQRWSTNAIRFLIAFVATVVLVTLYLLSVTIGDRHLETQPVLRNDYSAVHPDSNPYGFISPTNVTRDSALDPITKRANATLLMLARNSDIDGVEKSMRSLESKFNKNYNYPWIFLNEVPFTREFKARVVASTGAEVQFGLIPHDHWFQPDWIDGETVQRGKDRLAEFSKPWPIPYADSTPYRNMCRFNSGFFFRHDLLLPYKWYWRVEPDVDFTCEIHFDPFDYMIKNNKRYSFTVSLPEVAPTISSLWNTVKDFRMAYPDLTAEDNALPFISDTDGDTYNLCHFWSNFEIADLDFFRSQFYQAYFEFLDATGNFYYERWGDAPVHSIAVALFMPRDQIHFFNNIGYHHAPYQHCPPGALHAEGACTCSFQDNYDYTAPSCLRKFEKLFPKGKSG